MKKNIKIGMIILGLAILTLVVNEMLKTTSINGVNADEIKALVSRYSNGLSQGDEKTVFIDSKTLTITKTDQTTVEYSLPEDEFFVSIAPYYEATHPCSIHYLTSCYSELGNEVFDVLIMDAAGEVIVDETMMSNPNGFIDFWLPRDKTYTIKIMHNGKSVESSFSTFDGDNTCITTPMQLK